MADYMQPNLQTPSFFTRLQIVQESGVKKYMNNGGNFITGVDISSEESAERRDKRLQRFGHTPIQSATEVEFSLDKLEERAKRFGGSSRLHNGEVIKMFTKLPIIPEGDVRLEAVYIHGTNDMSTKDVLNYFALYGPSYIEWIDDSSCNTVWEDPSSAHRALFGKGLFPAMTEKELDTVTSTEEEGVKPIWRLGEVHPKSKQLLLRHATSGDVKKIGAASKSVYYKKYGNPGVPMGNRARKQKRNVIKSTWREEPAGGISNEGDLGTGGIDLRNKLTSLRKMEETNEEDKHFENDDVEDMEIGNEPIRPWEIGNKSTENGNESEETDIEFEGLGIKSQVCIVRNEPPKEPVIKSQVCVVRNETKNEPQEPEIKSQVHVVRNQSLVTGNKASDENEDESSDNDFIGKFRSDELGSNYEKTDLRRKLMSSRKPNIMSRIG